MKDKKPFEEMQKDELVAKCKRQQESLRIATNKIKSLTRELEIVRTVISERRLSQKLVACMEETLSYMREVEYYKKKYGV